MKTQSNLTSKTFMTKDSKGCEFKCQCQIVRQYPGGPIVESHYYADGLNVEANTLYELKDKIAEL